MQLFTFCLISLAFLGNALIALSVASAIVGRMRINDNILIARNERQHARLGRIIEIAAGLRAPCRRSACACH